MARELISRPVMWMRDISYELLEMLGEGGQGRVFKALRRDRETGLCETVALKILHSETELSLWKQEFESLRRVRSPFCVQVMSFDRVDGRPALVLEFVDGVSLSHLGRACVLDDSDIEEVLAQLESALHDLESSGLFHGDLSPANVLIDREGRVKLLDFGLANSGGRLTPDFAAPERLAGAAPTLASDLYSLGTLESFLRGHPAGTFDRPEYLAPEPTARRYRGLHSSDESMRRLGDKAALWLQRSQWVRRCRTKTMQALRLTRPPSWAARAALIPLILVTCFLTPSGASQRPKPHPFAVLMVRTLKWHKLSLDGRSLGYSPVTVALPANTDAVLEWSSATGRGRKALRAQPGQRIVILDRDFTSSGGTQNGIAGGPFTDPRDPGRRTNEGRAR